MPNTNDTPQDPLCPSDKNRAEAVAFRFNEDANDYRVDGYEVYDAQECGVWCYTVEELEDSSISIDPDDIFSHGGFRWVTFPI